MLIEDHEMNIRLEMFFVQFDSFAKTACNAPPFIFKTSWFWFCLSFLFVWFFFCSSVTICISGIFYTSELLDTR